jgi:hypothetical protein
VCQAEQRSSAPMVVCKGTVKRYSARLRAQKSEQASDGAPDSEQDLSGAPPNCPVFLCQKLQRSEPNGLVTWPPDIVRCAIRHKPSPTAILVVGAINTPQPSHFNASKFSAIKPHTRALDFIPRHKQRDQILSQVRNHSKQISD